MQQDLFEELKTETDQKDELTKVKNKYRNLDAGTIMEIYFKFIGKSWLELVIYSNTLGWPLYFSTQLSNIKSSSGVEDFNKYSKYYELYQTIN